MQKLLFNPANFKTHLSMLTPALYNVIHFKSQTPLWYIIESLRDLTNNLGSKYYENKCRILFPVLL